jgi:D-alanyl-D-alanine carboxypeptidase/D-alanyl-D-alanine-endopeptidase (penicillin-binding protein 4)
VVLVAACQGTTTRPPTSPGATITEVRAYQPPAPIGAEALIRKHNLSGAGVGYVLVDLESGKAIAGRNENALFIPASTAKVASTVAALNILGPGYRFETKLLITGKVARGDKGGGILEGDLTLRGGGDPLLTVQDLMRLARQLKDLGVSRVNGRFFYDQSFLKTAARIDGGQPENARYNPGLSALSLDFNQSLLSWRPVGKQTNKPGQVQAFETPDLGGPKPGLSPADPGAGNNVVPGDDKGRWLLSPSAAAEGSEFLPVKKPGLRTALVFRRLCRMLGLTLPEPTEGTAPLNALGDARPIVSVRGLPLADVVRLALEHSNNMVAELIGQVAARKLGGGAKELAEGSALLGESLMTRLQKKIPGVRWDGFNLPNHSGLTSKARVSPKQMAAIVRLAALQRFGGGSYLSLLPASGLRDSMRGRFRDPATALKIWAKTGTLKYAKGMAGVFFADSGRRVAFALYVTDFSRRRAYDAAANAQSPAVAVPADDWIGRAEVFEQDLIREWILGN